MHIRFLQRSKLIRVESIEYNLQLRGLHPFESFHDAKDLPVGPQSLYVAALRDLICIHAYDQSKHPGCVGDLSSFLLQE